MGREWIVTVGGGFGSSETVERVLSVAATSGSRMRFVVAGRVVEADVIQVSSGVWSVIADGRSFLIDVDTRGARQLVSVDGIEAQVHVDNAWRKRLAEAAPVASRKAGELITAPISGRVVKVLVAVDDLVTPGQAVAVLEAMKMENEIKATRGGRARRVAATVGDSVDASDLLVELV